LTWTEVGDLQFLASVVIGTLTIVGAGSLVKIWQLRAGGTAIAESLGGRRIDSNTTNLNERKVINVIEEMALASGIPTPPVYFLDREPGINAFAAGFTPSDAVIGVTRGTVETLSRDELQGVIAHEFSHILNGDMRLNLRLIGLLNGILVIGIIGYYIFRIALSSGSGLSSRKRGNLSLFIVIGGAIMVIGYVGTFFGKLIKAAVSRQREYLADASSVQFTRNPSGIAGALKKIGGFAAGSRVQSPNAPEVSHMFFGESVPSWFGGLLATHPPLPSRIQRIDPSWKGEFEVTSALSEQGVAESPTIEAATSRLAGQATRPRREPIGAREIESAMAQAGRPTENHVHYAVRLIQGLPATIVAAARESYGARALVFALVINRESETRAKQLDWLSRSVDQGVNKLTLKLLPLVEALAPEVRLPLVDLAVPSLRTLSTAQYQEFKESLVALITADQKIDLFEWMLQRVMFSHVEPQFMRVRAPRVRYQGLDPLRSQCQLLLSTVAHAGASDARLQAVAFERGASNIGLPGLAMEPAERCSLQALDQALHDLAETAPRLKKQLLNACVACITADRQVTVSEAEILRAIADSLGCPIPPFLAGETSV
jgi:Zn-dependent protease with chaperone function